mgnify:CR=1 FL=1
MIYNEYGSGMLYNGAWYAVGQRVIANDVSDYEGLVGTITEIREGEDKETENKTVDIYCDFEVPASPYEIQKLEKRFSEVYGCPKQVDDLSLDEVIMAPEMLVPLGNIIEQHKIIVYLLHEDWMVDGEGGYSANSYLDIWQARFQFHQNLAEEQENGYIEQWNGRDDLKVDARQDFYECYLDGRYCDNHYTISIQEEVVGLTDTQLYTLAQAYKEQNRMKDFTAFVEQWDQVACLTEKQYRELMADPKIPERIQNALQANVVYHEQYWDSIAEIANEMLNEYLKKNAHSDGQIPVTEGGEEK